jgi:hypothetical protein
MSDISPGLHAEIVLRAGNRCEYCRLSQLGQEAAFHIDHVIPRAAGGPTVADNSRFGLDRRAGGGLSGVPVIGLDTVSAGRHGG